ncbi:enoyl-CoA hydratase-related protein [Pseudomonas sp. Q1-7]|uniref:enoyl-CoA hydratase-related protein n=1 Tax=Pseudomonas sp. Q1-7 TaxID=3020843 RepID=UPI002300D589|nr:enoyl-CoA hydratase-related protein [Pseudomonas sp. Q1-7]
MSSAATSSSQKSSIPKGTSSQSDIVKAGTEASAIEPPPALRYETILVERRDRVGLLTLNRPKSLNALNVRMSQEVVAALRTFDADDNIGAIVIAGSPRAFAAGADIEEMADKTFVELQSRDIFAAWQEVPTISKPIIAAVSGYALGMV